jgi:hypothetical protein
LNQQIVLSLLGDALIHWAAIVGAVSVIVHARVPWWRTEMGRHLMVYMSAIDIVLILSCIRIDVGNDTWWFALLRLIVFIGVPIVMTQRMWLQLKAQRVTRDEKRDQERNP